MLQHLIDLNVDEDAFTPQDRLGANELFDAKVGTADVFQALGVLDDEDAFAQARSQEEGARAFSALIGASDRERLEAVGALSLPSSVRHSVAMLSQYQWDFVAKAQEIRSMTVSKIVAETDHPDARIRLQALRMLGSVTEVALFTERVEVKKTAQNPDEIETLIREKLAKFARMAISSEGVEDARTKDAVLAAPPAQDVEDAVIVEPAAEPEVIT